MPMLRSAWTAVLMLCVSCADPLPPQSSDMSGYPVSLSYAAAPVMMGSHQPSETDLAAYIRRQVPVWGLRPQSPELLASAIRSLAMDFDLDARILTAMIAQESAFDARAVSPTGAVGLTQLTISGISQLPALKELACECRILWRMVSDCKGLSPTQFSVAGRLGP